MKNILIGLVVAVIFFVVLFYVFKVVLITSLIIAAAVIILPILYFTFKRKKDWHTIPHIIYLTHQRYDNSNINNQLLITFAYIGFIFYVEMLY